MLLTITTEHQPATDLGYLLHKHPDRLQTFDLSFGQVHIYYPAAGQDRCVACLLLDVDPVAMVRGKNRDQSSLLGHYVNDRPYVASSFMSVAISQVFGTAMGGRCKDRPELVSKPIPLVAGIDVLPVRGGEGFLHKLFEPLGYTVEAQRYTLDEQFPEWGESPYYSITLTGTKTLSELLTHLYVLIPVFDNEKHYFVGEDELEKLLAKGGSIQNEDGTSWLQNHPEKDTIVRRYLKNRTALTNMALSRLSEGMPVEESDSEGDETSTVPDSSINPPPASLNKQRYDAVLAALRSCDARRVIDLGCGEGKFLRELMKDKQFDEIVGMDVSIRSIRGFDVKGSLWS